MNNEFPREFKNGKVTARVFNFDMREVLHLKAEVNVPAEALAKDILLVHFPADISPVHFIKLELADAKGKLISETFYWRSAQDYKSGRTWTGPLYEGFQELAKLPKVALDSKVKWDRHEKMRRHHKKSVRAFGISCLASLAARGHRQTRSAGILHRQFLFTLAG